MSSDGFYALHHNPHLADVSLYKLLLLSAAIAQLETPFLRGGL